MYDLLAVFFLFFLFPSLWILGIFTWTHPSTVLLDMNTDLFDLDTDLVLSQLPEGDLSQEWVVQDSPGGTHSHLSLKGKPRFCIFTEDKLAKKRFNPPVGAADIQKNTGRGCSKKYKK